MVWCLSFVCYLFRVRLRFLLFEGVFKQYFRGLAMDFPVFSKQIWGLNRRKKVEARGREKMTVIIYKISYHTSGLRHLHETSLCQAGSVEPHSYRLGGPGILGKT